MHLVDHAVEVDHLARLDRHAVQQLEGFLRLHGADDGGDGGRGGHFAEQDVLAGQQRAGIAHSQVAAGLLVQGAFEAGALPGDEDAHQTEQLLDGAIHPGLVHPIAEAVDRQAGFAVIQAADDHIHAADDTQPKLGGDIAVQVLDMDIRVELFDTGGGDLGFAADRESLSRKSGERLRLAASIVSKSTMKR